MINRHFKLWEPGYENLKNYQEAIHLGTGEKVSLNKLVNYILLDDIPKIKIPAWKLKQMELRFNDPEYKKMTAQFMDLSKAINKLRRMLINDSSNINQVAHKINGATTKTQMQSALKQASLNDWIGTKANCTYAKEQLDDISEEVGKIWDLM